VSATAGRGWTFIVFGDFVHLLPEDEMECHHPKGCLCMPRVDEIDEGMIIHNSLDGREAFEEGERKPS
jgi:hypothetical protein